MFNYISPQNSLWVSFLEKAWAKVNGFYEQIRGGQADEVFQFLFGNPTQSIDKGKTLWTNAEDIFQLVAKSDDQQFVIWAGTSGGGDD